MKIRIKSIITEIILLIFGAFIILPFVWMIASSFKTNSEIFSSNFSFFPKAFTFNNYQQVLPKFNFIRYFFNSILYSVLITLITIYTSSISGFVLSKYSFRGKNIVFYGILFTMMIPGVVTIIPRYSIMKIFGWLDSFKGLVVPSLFTAFGIFLMKQSCSVIPDEMLDAARIDGVGEFYLFNHIVFPQLHNAVVSLGIFQFLWAWDDYLWPYLITRSDSKQLLAVGLKLFNGRYSTDYAGLFAATSLAILPVIIVYLIFQKRFIAGVSSASIKG